MPVNVRIIVGTKRDLKQMVAEGTFREDLYYRLNVLAVTLPPLRERREDIPMLMEYFLQRSFRQRGEDPPPIPAGVMQAFGHYAWPGNVRELENMCERMAQTNTCGTMRTGCVAAGIMFQATAPPPSARVDDAVSHGPAPISLEGRVRELETSLITWTLKASDGEENPRGGTAPDQPVLAAGSHQSISTESRRGCPGGDVRGGRVGMMLTSGQTRGDGAAPMKRLDTMTQHSIHVQPAVTRGRAIDAGAVLRSAAVGATSATYQSSDAIFCQGDAADSVLCIQEGSVKLSVLSRGGKEAVVAMLGTGAFFGEAALAGRPDRLETAVAVTATTVLMIQKERMIRLLHDDSAVSDCFIAHMLARNNRLEGDLADQLLNSSEKRLARTLLLLAGYGKPGETRRALPRVSQETLAEMIGTTKCRVNVFMNRFKRCGFIEDDGGLKINDALLTVILRDEIGEAIEQRAG